MWFMYYVTDSDSNGVQLKIQTRTNGANRYSFIKSKNEGWHSDTSEVKQREEKRTSCTWSLRHHQQRRAFSATDRKKPTQNQLTKWKIKCIEYTIKIQPIALNSVKFNNKSIWNMTITIFCFSQVHHRLNSIRWLSELLQSGKTMEKKHAVENNNNNNIWIVSKAHGNLHHINLLFFLPSLFSLSLFSLFLLIKTPCRTSTTLLICGEYMYDTGVHNVIFSMSPNH